jgi:uncharacterized phage protein gp47/JayE
VADFERFFSDNAVPVTESAMKDRFKQIVSESGSAISNDSRYSPFWRAISAMITTPALWMMNTLVSQLAPQFYLKTASGSYLDDWAANYDVFRKVGQPTIGKLQFHRLEADQERTIAAGTAINTLSINGQIYSVFLVDDLFFAEGVAYAETVVSSVAHTSATNLDAGYYTQIDEPGVSVNHGIEWIDQVGVDDESDESLRERVRLRFNRLAHYHTDGVYRSIISEHANVPPENIFFEHNAPRGPATANAFILFPLSTPAASVLSRVNRHIREEGHHGHGDDVLVMSMPRKMVSISATAYIDNELIEIERERLKFEIEQAIRAAFRENAAYTDLTLTLPNTHFSFARLTGELIRIFPDLDDINFDQDDIDSAMEVPAIQSLVVTIGT